MNFFYRPDLEEISFRRHVGSSVREQRERRKPTYCHELQLSYNQDLVRNNCSKATGVVAGTSSGLLAEFDTCTDTGDKTSESAIPTQVVSFQMNSKTSGTTLSSKTNSTWRVKRHHMFGI